MRDFLITGEDQRFRGEVAGLLAEVLGPSASKIEDHQDWEAVKKAVRAVARKGYLSLLFPGLYPGKLTHPGLTHAAIFSEESSFINYAFESTIASSLSCAYALHRFGSDRLRETFLPPLVSGEAIGSICITEEQVGSDVSGMQTRIIPDDDLEALKITGFKRYISNASVADTYLVYGIDDPELPPHRGMGAVLVPGGADGVEFPRLYTFMGRKGCVVGEVEFSGCRVPAWHRIGSVGKGFSILVSMFNFERILLAASALGLARKAFDMARDHAQERVSFGQKLGCKQLIWNQISEMSWRLDASELLTYRAAKMYDSGIHGKSLMKEAAMAKLVATETANLCADRTVQILGGDGITKEYGPAEQLYRDARALTIVGGTSEMVRYLIAAVDMPHLKPNL
ncbi:MAG: acyl-CoA dehydrogenase family protein [Deltaproteobacteria bacterium]|nr:acyl-CoA dehydrogenase family protein [Deltaproteobacteria bacterium]